VPGFEDDDTHTFGHEVPGGGQSGKSAPDDDDVGRARSLESVSRTCVLDERRGMQLGGEHDARPGNGRCGSEKGPSAQRAG
jgi:hypothetical protein